MNKDDHNKDKDYEVGYGKPPKRSQFKKGQSGNPKGRPKPSKNLNEAFAKVLLSKIEVKEKGKTKKVMILDAIPKKLANMALNGDMRAMDKLLKRAENIPFEIIMAEERNTPLEPPSPAIQEARAILQELIQKKLDDQKLEETQNPEESE